MFSPMGTGKLAQIIILLYAHQNSQFCPTMTAIKREIKHTRVYALRPENGSPAFRGYAKWRSLSIYPRTRTRILFRVGTMDIVPRLPTIHKRYLPLRARLHLSRSPPDIHIQDTNTFSSLFFSFLSFLSIFLLFLYAPFFRGGTTP